MKLQHLHLALRFAAITLASVCASAQAPNEPLHAPDGNTRYQFNNILIPPKAGAPFAATVHAEWTRQLPDGTTITVRNHRLVVRDGNGRIYQERRELTTDGDRQQTRLVRIEISDPVKHIKYLCATIVHVCELRDYFMIPTPSEQGVTPEHESRPGLVRENLGKDIVAGLETVGTRETFTLKPGSEGNEGTITITKEFWYSPQLDLNLSVKRTDPLHGNQVFSVSDVTLAEPDAGLFALPAGFKTVDARRTPATANPPTR